MTITHEIPLPAALLAEPERLQKLAAGQAGKPWMHEDAAGVQGEAGIIQRATVRGDKMVLVIELNDTPHARLVAELLARHGG